MADSPEVWFDIKNYRAAARFTPEQWAQQIVRRLMIQGAMDNQDQRTLDQLMGTLTSSPLAPWPSGQRNGSRLVSHLPYSTSTVYPLTFRDVQLLANAQQASNASDASVCDEIFRQSRLWGLDRFPHLTVDLDARDEQIKEDFSRWLKAYREIAGRPQTKPLTRANLDRWHEEKVLPYFDLIAWAKWSGAKLTQEKILPLLFPHDEEAMPDLLRNVKKQAKSAISWPTYSSLCNLLENP